MWGLFSYGAGDECDGSYEDGFVHGWLHTWAAVCGALAPAFGIIVWIFMMVDCFCKVCCSSVMQTTLLSFAEVRAANCVHRMFISYVHILCSSSAAAPSLQLSQAFTFLMCECVILFTSLVRQP